MSEPTLSYNRERKGETNMRGRKRRREEKESEQQYRRRKVYHWDRGGDFLGDWREGDHRDYHGDRREGQDINRSAVSDCFAFFVFFFDFVSGLVTGLVLTVRPPTQGRVSAAYTVGTSGETECNVVVVQLSIQKFLKIRKRIYLSKWQIKIGSGKHL